MAGLTRQGVRDLGHNQGNRRWPEPAPLYCSHVWVSRLAVDTPNGLVFTDDDGGYYVKVCAKCGAPSRRS
jgi:hypothetical protein